jgi:hypothetical protein
MKHMVACDRARMQMKHMVACDRARMQFPIVGYTEWAICIT